MVRLSYVGHRRANTRRARALLRLGACQSEEFRGSGAAMRVTLIHNPGAGEEGQPDAEDLRRLVRAAGHEVWCVSSKEPGWEAALDRPAELIAIAGGDGTV